MIIFPQKISWLWLLFRTRDSVSIQTWKRVLAITALSGVVTWLHHSFTWFSLNPSALPFTVMGLALSIFLGFRNSTSYDRYWEGRKLWGGLVNTSRNLARRCLTLIRSADEPAAVAAHQRETIYLIIAWAHSLRCHLRGDAYETLKALISDKDYENMLAWSHPPLYLAQRLGQQVRTALDRGWIDPLHLALLEEPLSALVDIQGACERIRNTPIPITYVSLLHQLVMIYCLALPLELVGAFDLYTPLFVLIVAYALLGLAAIGDSVENPFELEPHDLPLSQLCRMIEINLRTQLGESDLPSPLEPDSNGVLL